MNKEFVSMMNERVIKYFKRFSEVFPRDSKKEGAAADWIIKLAREEFEISEKKIKRSTAIVDGVQTNNVLISKPAIGDDYKKLPVVILQGHIDMVCQKNPDSDHDFYKQGIEIIERTIGDQNIMVANGTTLGADDGIGVASALAILSLTKEECEEYGFGHPPIQALFTSDEEAGMSGASIVDEEFLKGEGVFGVPASEKKLINIDTETEGVMYYGCAGGVDASFELPISYEPIPNSAEIIQVVVEGLQGGHSGVEIHKGNANAHKILGRTLMKLDAEIPGIRIIKFTGGDRKNVITREANVYLSIPYTRQKDSQWERVKDILAELEETFKEEYHQEKEIDIYSIKQVSFPTARVLSRHSTLMLIATLIAIPDGVQAWHTEIQGLVETSCNLGVVEQKEDSIFFNSFIRSFFESKKQLVADQIRIIAIGGLRANDFKLSNDFPVWSPNTNSELVRRFIHGYQEAFGKDPVIESIHAGLECGYFARTFPGMDIIACGPTITGAHTPEETLYTDTVPMVTELLLTVINDMKTDPLKDDISDIVRVANPGLHNLCTCCR